MDTSAVVAMTLVFVIIFGFSAFWRYLEYRETLALAEKGLIHPQRPRGDDKNTLRWGILITALGLALCVGLYPLAFFMGSFGEQLPLRFGPWMLIGLIPTFFGLGLVLVYILTREARPAPPPADPNPPKPLE